MGIIPLCFSPGEDAETLELTGHERYTIDLPKDISEITPGQEVIVKTDNGKSFKCTLRFDTEVIGSTSTLLPILEWRTSYVLMFMITFNCR